MEPHGPAVRRHHPVLLEVGLPALGRSMRLRQDLAQIIRVDHPRPEARLRPLRRRVPEELLDLRTDVGGRRGLVEARRLRHLLVRDGRGVLDDRAVAFLGDTDLLLGFLPLRDVEHEALEERHGSVVVQHGRGGVLHPDPMAVRMAHPIDLVERVEVVDAESLARAERREVVGMDHLEPDPRVGDEAIGRIAQHVLDLRAHERHRGAHPGPALRGLVDVGHRGDRFHHAPVPMLGLPEQAFRFLPGRHVDHEALEVRDRSTLTRHGRRGVMDPDPVTVDVPHPVFLVEGQPLMTGRGRRRLHPPAVLRMDQVEPEVGVGEEPLGRIAEERFDLGADERHPRAGGLHHVDVRHRRDPLNHAAVARLGREEPFLLTTTRDRGAEQRGGRPEPFEVGHRPIANTVAIIEADAPPPDPVHRDREVSEGDDRLAPQGRALLFGEGLDRADDRLPGAHPLDPAGVVRLPHQAVHDGVASVGVGAWRAPLRCEPHR